MIVQAKTRRPRRIAADEAHAWARNLRLGNPYAKLVLSMLTIYVNGEGSCFVSVAALAEDCELALETVRRRLAWLEGIGAVTRLPQWIDDNGRRNGDGRGRRTTDDIRLMIHSDPDEIEAKAHGNGDDGGGGSGGENPESAPLREGGGNSDEDTAGPPVRTLATPSLRRGPKFLEPEPEEKKDSPPTPPRGGEVQADDGWKEFEEAWHEPILRQSIARQVWSALNDDERKLAARAARGYVIHRKAQKKPPNVINAHTFLRETDAWSRFAALASAEGGSSASNYSVETAEGRAIYVLHEIARARPFEPSAGCVYYRLPVTPQLLALTLTPPRSQWPFLEDHQQIGAWRELIAASVTIGRPTFIQELSDGRRGIYAPWPWPPRKDGTLSTTGPPDTLMTEADHKEVAEHGL